MNVVLNECGFKHSLLYTVFFYYISTDIDECLQSPCQAQEECTKTQEEVIDATRDVQAH